MTFDPAQLCDALGRVAPSSWSLPSTFQTTGAHHGYRQVTLVSAGQRQPASDPFGFVLDGFEPVWSAWLSWIEPGGYIVTHRDGGPYRERWQVPIVPGDFNGTTAQAGVPFRVAHWEPHRVDPQPGPRIHLVIDRDVLLDVPDALFAVVEET